MSGAPGRSGGWNKKSAEEHRLAGTFRRDRHAPPPGEAAPVSAAARRRVLEGLNPMARRMAVDLLASFEGWDSATLHTLRAYCLSCARLVDLEQGADTLALHREIRSNIALQRALDLERGQ